MDRPVVCPECGAEWDGDEEDQCPECGWLLDEEGEGTGEESDIPEYEEDES